MKYIFELWGGLMVVDSVMRMVLRWFRFFVLNSFPFPTKKHQKYLYGNQVILSICKTILFWNVSEFKMCKMCVISYVLHPIYYNPYFYKVYFLVGQIWISRFLGICNTFNRCFLQTLSTEHYYHYLDHFVESLTN